MRLLRGMTLLVLLTGCALHTPSELRALQPLATFESTLTPAQAARCLGRAAEEYPVMLGDAFIAVWREGDDAGSYELVVSSHGHPRVFGTLLPMPDGSRATLWQSPYLVYAGLSEGIAAKCAARNLNIRSLLPPASSDPHTLGRGAVGGR